MWKAAAGAQINIKNDIEDDDWETDPDFINNVTEEEQRWGSTTVEGSGRTAGAIDMEKLRRETEEEDAKIKKKLLEEGPNPSYGYGGKFGVQADRMDKSAVGHDYVGKVEKHASQKDYSTGFGGKFGVQTDRIDKSAVNWDYKERVEKHASQKDYSTGFGGKFGVQKDRQDKSAVGWDHVEKVEKHESQKDYSKGFGGKFGVQSDRIDKSAVGWDHHEAPQMHESQLDHKKGFGGKFGLQTDRMDKSAVTFDDQPARVGTNYTKVRPDIGNAKPSQLRAKFENLPSERTNSAPSNSQPTSRKNIQDRLAAFNNNANKNESAPPPPQPASENVPKQLDQSKLAFLNQQNLQDNSSTERVVPKQLDQTKLSQFAAQTVQNESAPNQIKEELEHIRQMQQQKQQDAQEPKAEEQKYEQVKEGIEHKSEQVKGGTEQKHEEVKGGTEQKVAPVQPTLANAQVQEAPATAAAVAAGAAAVAAGATAVAAGAAATTAEPEFIQEDDIVDTGLTAVALYDYQAGADDEISFDPDDIITHVEMIDEGWWRGLCNGQYGLFPANYVQLQQ